MGAVLQMLNLVDPSQRKFVRAIRSEHNNSAMWLVKEKANFFANWSRCLIPVVASNRANKFAKTKWKTGFVKVEAI